MSSKGQLSQSCWQRGNDAPELRRWYTRYDYAIVGYLHNLGRSRPIVDTCASCLRLTLTESLSVYHDNLVGRNSRQALLAD